LFLSSAHRSTARPDAWIEEARTTSTLDGDDDDADDHDHSEARHTFRYGREEAMEEGEREDGM